MTDTSFTLKQNAKRAASRMIATGNAPSLDFDIVPQGDLFAIQWGAPTAKAPVDADVHDEPGSVTPLVQYQRKADAKAAADAMLKSAVAPGRKYTVAGEAGHWSIIWTVAPAEPKTERTPRAAATADTPRKPRQGTEQQAVIEMMRRPEGASGAEIMTFTGWSIVRGFIAGTVKKKLGLPVTTEMVEGRGTVYRIPAAA